MDKHLKCLVDILQGNPQGVEVYSMDILPLQREASADGVIISAKRVPYQYETRQGYTWAHNNSRVYNLTLKQNG